MAHSPRFVVLIPVYNHGVTVARVVSESARFFPAIVVNDGSTDQTAGALGRSQPAHLITFPANRGKAAALRAGFARARELNFTHVITLDADGQHPPAAIPAFAEVARAHPQAVIVGVRDLKAAGAPWARRASNALSNFFFKFETRFNPGDTQCGFRVYPLAIFDRLEIRSGRYAYELELLVRAAWAGVPLVPCKVEVDYLAPTSRLSHFHPFYDLAHVCFAHSRLAWESLFVSRPRPAR